MSYLFYPLSCMLASLLFIAYQTGTVMCGFLLKDNGVLPRGISKELMMSVSALTSGLTVLCLAQFTNIPLLCFVMFVQGTCNGLRKFVINSCAFIFVADCCLKYHYCLFSSQ
jgi:hypothetical protein